MHLVPRLRLLGARYPDLRIDLILQDSIVDMVGQGLDLAIRFGEPQEPNLIARRLGTMRMIVIASKAYLDRWGRPQKPEDLKDHNCLVFGGIPEGDQWPFTEDGQTRQIGVNWRLRNEQFRRAASGGPVRPRHRNDAELAVSGPVVRTRRWRRFSTIMRNRHFRCMRSIRRGATRRQRSAR